MAREDAHFKMRLPEDLLERIREEAAAAGRSMNAEVVSRMRAAYALPEPEAAESPMLALAREQTDLLRRIAARLEA